MYVWIKLSWRLKLLYNIKWVANCIGISGIIHFPNYQWEEEQFTLVFKCNVWTNLIRFPGHYISCETFFHKYSMDTPTKIAQEIRFILQGWFLEFLFLFLFFFTSQNPVWSHGFLYCHVCYSWGSFIYKNCTVCCKTLFSPKIAQYLRNDVLLKAMKHGGPI